MFKPRVDHELPFVSDANDDVEAILAEHLLDVVGAEKPGVGINNDQQDPSDNITTIHARHQDLILRALALVNGSDDGLLANSGRFGQVDYHVSKYGSQPHIDGMYPEQPRLQGRDIPGRARVVLRLHTNDLQNSSDITFVSTTPGSHAEVGDRRLFTYTGLPTDRVVARGYGYDSGKSVGRRDRFGQMRQKLDAGATLVDTTVFDNNIYHHHEAAGSSVVFRSLATFGQVAIHDFSNQANLHRPYQISQIDVYSNVSDLA